MINTINELFGFQLILKPKPPLDPELTACLQCGTFPMYAVKNHVDGFMCYSCRTTCAGFSTMKGLIK